MGLTAKVEARTLCGVTEPLVSRKENRVQHGLVEEEVALPSGRGGERREGRDKAEVKKQRGNTCTAYVRTCTCTCVANTVMCTCDLLLIKMNSTSPNFANDNKLLPL